MLVREKISPIQLAFILIPVVLATELLTVSGIMAQFAKQDAWMSVIPSSITGVWTILVMTALSKRYPGMSIIEYASEILGKWAGKILGLYYTYVLFIYGSTIAVGLTSFITLFSHPLTPKIVTVSMFVFVCGLGVWAGIEVIGRCSEFLIPINIFLLIPCFLFSTFEWKPDYLQPVLAKGFFPVIQGAVMPSAWMGEFFLLGFLLPYLNRPNLGRKVSLIAIGIVLAIMLGITFQCILVEGPITSKLTYPYFTAIRYISIGDVFERLDPIVITVWVFGGFIKESVFLFVFCLCVSHLFELKSYRILVIPGTLLVLVGAMWTMKGLPDAAAYSEFLAFTFPLHNFVVANLIPTFLLVISFMRSRRQAIHEI